MKGLLSLQNLGVFEALLQQKKKNKRKAQEKGFPLNSMYLFTLGVALPLRCKKSCLPHFWSMFGQLTICRLPNWKFTS